MIWSFPVFTFLLKKNQPSPLNLHLCPFNMCVYYFFNYYILKLSTHSPVMAATQMMKVLARRWPTLCLWVKARIEGLMEDRTNTGALEELMQRWGHCQETGEGNTWVQQKWGFFLGIIGRWWNIFDKLNLTAWSKRVEGERFLWICGNILGILLRGI